MIFINRLTAPGEIKRLTIYPDAIKVKMYDGKELVYTNPQELERRENTNDNGSTNTASDMPQVLSGESLVPTS